MDRIYRIYNGAPVELTERAEGKRYAQTPEGMREYTPEEEAQRDAEEAEFAARKAAEASQPPPPTMEERMAAVEAELATLRARLP